MRIEDGFQPIPYSEENVYLEDPTLPSLLRRLLPNSVLRDVQPDLERLGKEVLTVIRPLADSAAVSNPTLTQYDQWGRRIDNLETSEGWRKLKAIAQQEGLPGIFYERTYGEHSRIYGFAKMLLMVGDTQEVFCPLSMTDGTARVIELIGNPALKRDVLPRLISRDPSQAFTAGQWMTERPGGSDVSLTETTATDLSQTHSYGPKYSLNGIKWFSSATDSEVSVALARTGSISAGSRGLSLFLIPLRLPLFPAPSDSKPSSTSNNIFIHRLKNKIGTHVLPTAELSLQNTEGYLISPLNQGVKHITPVLNITRLWSAITSVGHLRKCLSIATSYARVRAIKSGTQLLQDNPLHVAQLAQINLLYRALTHMCFSVAGLMGKVECGVASGEEAKRLRMLTPVVKAFCAEKASVGMEEAMSALGGAGYMEENGIGRAIRDGLVEKIWEGTVVVLALDLARSALDPSTLKAFTSWAETIIDSIPSSVQPRLNDATGLLREALATLPKVYSTPMHPLAARPGLMVVGYIASSISLLEHALWALNIGEPTHDVDIEVARRWVLDAGFNGALEDLKKALSAGEDQIKLNKEIVFGTVSNSVRTKL
ncbi:acyl-CoA dehydrogenase domain-containing protein [Coprinopsis cinerea okayama7|uniref:Acyl-CoA dehydrogenase domain-containing protein n=1 Tax=Coprinopsis cinerea (strain Okayama-7 / 130 / ATCC MYA-4618 / FGSC 9003) TaxID=240176 RepID=A8NRK2_COPC7|nr:acyl-CoA dehydrogenase domain-containing protein [Coprinopsis cinerea okayama7\|eukprot:XP_001835802.1 acyl-CoA dehydrogenase domain-containing protein [Coprinopsis cinerea okayama7\